MLARRTRWRLLIRPLLLSSNGIVFLIVNGMLFRGSRQPLRLPISDVGPLPWSCIVILPHIVCALLLVDVCFAKGSGTHTRVIGSMLMENAQSLLLAIRRLDGKNRVAIVIFICVIPGFFIRQAHSCQVISQMVSICIGGAGSCEHVLEIFKETAGIAWHRVPDLLTLEARVIQGPIASSAIARSLKMPTTVEDGVTDI